MPSDSFGLYISTGMGEYRERFNLKLLRITINRDLIDIFQVRKINYNLRHSQKFVSTKKKLSKNGSRDNKLPCTSIMEPSSNRD